jgi:glucose-6-phosphate isomerase
LDAPHISRALLPRLAELRRELANEGIDHIVLAGMGGSSLAPEVICNTAGAPLTVLDTTDPGQVRAAIEDRLERTLVVVSSKSGGTVETDSHRRAYTAAFEAAGVKDVGRRFVAVTDPGSPLEKIARDSGFREVFLADANVGGRYSALTAFGLVPSALAGVDVERLLDDAEALAATLASDDGNPSLQLGAVLGGAGVDGRDKVVLADSGSGIAGFGDWAEQLIAESTGKSGRGLLPVVVESPDAPGTAPAGDVHLVTLGGPTGKSEQTSVSGPLGAQFLAWEYATAVAGRVLQIDPFNQPNVQESKDNTNALLKESGDGPLPEGTPAFTDGSIAVYGDGGLLGNASTVADSLAALLRAVPDRGYLVVMAYLDRFADAAAHEIRALLAGRLAHPVTFGWGPRFLHSTGQYHKGGPQVGAFLQITGEATTDLDIPGRPYTFARLQRAQALGDLGALAQRGRPVLRLHLQDRATGLPALLDAARSLPEG